MVFNATFNSISVISWRSVLLVEKNGVNQEKTYTFFPPKCIAVSPKRKTVEKTTDLS